MDGLNRRDLIEYAKGFVLEGLYDGFTHFCDNVGWQEWMANIVKGEEATAWELSIIDGILKAIWLEAEEEVEQSLLVVSGKTYAERKADAREKAIEWQNYASNRSMSYGELAFWGEHFEKVGRRFGLLGEFRENGIC